MWSSSTRAVVGVRVIGWAGRSTMHVAVAGVRSGRGGFGACRGGGALSERLRVSVGELAAYGRREQTRTRHLQQVARYLGWRAAGVLEWKELDEFLLARAMEHDSPSLLFRLACEHLISSRVMRPGVVTVLEHVATARAAAERETHGRVAHLVTPGLERELDGLLLVDAGLGMTRLKWLTTPPVSDSPGSIKTELAKLSFLSGIGARALDLSVLPAERRRFLTAVGRRLTAQSIPPRMWSLCGCPHRRLGR